MARTLYQHSIDAQVLQLCKQKDKIIVHLKIVLNQHYLMYRSTHLGYDIAYKTLTDVSFMMIINSFLLINIIIH